MRLIKKWNPITSVEMNAFLSLLQLARTYRAKLEALRDMWSSEHGWPIFTATMSVNRFVDILRFLRFDNKASREHRRASDKLAALRNIWELFAAQLPKFYVPRTDITVDEQLVPFRGKCPFRQYIPSKPAKYGIKVLWACDSETSYPLKGEVSLGRQPNQDRDVEKGAGVVLRLTKPWMKSGRNIIGDNFFTNLPLAEKLFAEQTT